MRYETLTCGCDLDWPDHRCMGGNRPSYCSCGAPDDCYCPSPGETLRYTLDEVIFPATITVRHFLERRITHTTQWICFTIDDAVDFLLAADIMTDDITLTGANFEDLML